MLSNEGKLLLPSTHIILLFYFLQKIFIQYNILDSLDRDRFRYSAVFIMYIKACGEKS